MRAVLWFYLDEPEVGILKQGGDEWEDFVSV